MRELDLHEEDATSSDDVREMSVIEPQDVGGGDAHKIEGISMESEAGSRTTHTNIPAGASRSDSQSRLDSAEKNEHERYKSSYRLSVPPSYKLDPPDASARPLPLAPHKSDPPDTSYQPHPVYPIDEWIVRTPSPVKSTRDGISTPPLGRRRGLNPVALMSVIASSWKRRGTPSSECSNDVGSGRTSRSVS
jgi:hypothetical protein